jgi:hypothetical protein
VARTAEGDEIFFHITSGMSRQRSFGKVFLSFQKAPVQFHA